MLPRIIMAAAQSFFGVEGLSNYLCLTGPPLSGKTSLLFQHAISCAEEGLCTVFITPRPWDQLPLCLKTGQLQVSHKTLSKILFKYLSSLATLQSVFDQAHLPNGLAAQSPDCIIIDDFHHYFSQIKTSGHEATSSLTRTCAHIVDGLSHISSTKDTTNDEQPQSTKQPVCFLSLAIQPYMNVDVIGRWFPSILSIAETGPNHFTVENINHKQLIFSYDIKGKCFEISKSVIR